MPKSAKAKRGNGRRRRNDASGADGYRPMSVPKSFDFGGTVGFPRKLRVRHRYTQQNLQQLDSVLQFSCNGLYDPGLSLFSGQPLYFDQLSAIYAHYTVFASKCTFSILSKFTYPTPVCGYIAPDTTTATSFSQAREQPSAVYKVIPGFNGTGTGEVVVHWNAKDYFGGDVYDNDDLQGTAAANPVEQSYFTLYVGPLGSETGEVVVQVTLEFDAVWDELRTIGLS